MTHSISVNWRSEWRVEDPLSLEREPLVTGTGRGRLMLLHHPKALVLERPYRHGGLRRHLLPSWFFQRGRARREFEAHLSLWRSGLPTAEPVGWATCKGLVPGSHKFWFYSVFLPDAQPLPRLLAGRLPARFGSSHAKLLARCLRCLYDAGWSHSDLNLNNWLWDGTRILLIDFDRAEKRTHDRDTFLTRALERMWRSARKLGLAQSRFAALRVLVSVAELFERDPRTLLKSLSPDHEPPSWFRRLRWKLGGGHQKIA